MLKVKDLNVAYGTLQILKNVDFELEKGCWLMIAGPNGAGKSTLLNAISQNIKYTGSIFFNDKDIKDIRPKERAKLIGILSQNHYVGYSFTVGEVVEMGRYAHSTGLFTSSGNDEDCVKNALQLTGMTEFENKSVLTLSGGELQRTFLAQLIAQDPQLMLLDEPANHLDIIYQKQVFELISKWIKKTGRSVISVVHDLSLAKKFGTHAILMNNGSIYAEGRTDDVLSKDNLLKVYGIDVYGWMNDMHEQWR
ncbi:MAG: ABC transporter ATP-binding protein [Christensenellaceae bacterium]|nr:ABC transporter ATP-binding protein [Christensenellaceae bacterium]